MNSCTRSLLLLCVVLPTACSSAPEPPAITTIAFGSCARSDEDQPIWDRIVAAEPELFLFIGDNIYADTEDMATVDETGCQRETPDDILAPAEVPNDQGTDGETDPPQRPSDGDTEDAESTHDRTCLCGLLDLLELGGLFGCLVTLRLARPRAGRATRSEPRQ